MATRLAHDLGTLTLVAPKQTCRVLGLVEHSTAIDTVTSKEGRRSYAGCREGRIGSLITLCCCLFRWTLCMDATVCRPATDMHA